MKDYRDLIMECQTQNDWKTAWQYINEMLVLLTGETPQQKINSDSDAEVDKARQQAIRIAMKHNSQGQTTQGKKI